MKQMDQQPTSQEETRRALEMELRATEKAIENIHQGERVRQYFDTEKEEAKRLQELSRSSSGTERPKVVTMTTQKEKSQRVSELRQELASIDSELDLIHQQEEKRTSMIRPDLNLSDLDLNIESTPIAGAPFEPEPATSDQEKRKNEFAEVINKYHLMLDTIEKQATETTNPAKFKEEMDLISSQNQETINQFDSFVDLGEIYDKAQQAIAQRIETIEQLLQKKLEQAHTSPEQQTITPPAISHPEEENERIKFIRERMAERAKRIQEREETIALLRKQIEALPDEEEPKIITREEIKDSIRQLLEKVKEVTKIEDIEIKGTDNPKEVFVRIKLRAQKAFVSAGIEIKATFRDDGSSIVLASKNIDAGMLSGAVNSIIEPELSKIGKYLKDFIEKQKGRKVQRIQITNGQLEAIL